MTFNNSINKKGFVYPGGPYLTGVSYVKAYIGNAGIGDIDLYTCPSGKQAAVLGMTLANTVFPFVGGVYSEIFTGGSYRQSGYQILSGSSLPVPNVFVGGVLQAGEKLAMRTFSLGTNIWADIVQFDILPNLKPIKYTLSNGNNTVYTVPAGKTAYIFGQYSSLSNYNAGMFISNQSGTSRNYSIYFVPSGSAPLTSNLFFSFPSTTNNYLVYSSAMSLNSGDSIVVNTDSGVPTQTVFLTPYEV